MTSSADDQPEFQDASLQVNPNPGDEEVELAATEIIAVIPVQKETSETLHKVEDTNKTPTEEEVKVQPKNDTEDRSEIGTVPDTFMPEHFGLLHDPGVIRFHSVDYDSEGEVNTKIDVVVVNKILSYSKRLKSLSLNDLNISCL